MLSLFPLLLPSNPAYALDIFDISSYIYFIVMSSAEYQRPKQGLLRCQQLISLRWIVALSLSTLKAVALLYHS